MTLPFYKMHAQGNDFIILLLPKSTLGEEQWSQLAISACDRHLGLGADGLVILDAPAAETPYMTIYNADGSKAENCGSALRCCAYLLYLEGLGAAHLLANDSGKHAYQQDKQDPALITIQMHTPQMLNPELQVNGHTGFHISVGNPHFVVFSDVLSDSRLQQLVQLTARSPFFPKGVNVELAHILNPAEVDIIIWERGVGKTLACGTGATATVFAGQSAHGLQDKVTVHMPGGDVDVFRQHDTFYLAGRVSLVAKGELIWTA